MSLLDMVTGGSDSLLGAVVGTVGKVLDRVLPDPAAKAAAAMELAKMQQAGEMAQLDASLKAAVGQLEVNKAEAASGSPYASGWRPTIGYVCGFAMAWNFVGVPIANYILTVKFPGTPLPPVLDFGPMLTVLMGMLGLGGLRTLEKVKGVA